MNRLLKTLLSMTIFWIVFTIIAIVFVSYLEGNGITASETIQLVIGGMCGLAGSLLGMLYGTIEEAK